MAWLSTSIYMLECDAGDVSAISWPLFKALCHQRFRPTLGTNHLSDLARLPFWGTMAEYEEAFQALWRMSGYCIQHSRSISSPVDYRTPSALTSSSKAQRIFNGPWDWHAPMNAA